MPVIAAIDGLEVAAQPHLDVEPRPAGLHYRGSLVAVYVVKPGHLASSADRAALWSAAPAGLPPDRRPGADHPGASRSSRPGRACNAGRASGNGCAGSTSMPAARNIPAIAAQIIWVT